MDKNSTLFRKYIFYAEENLKIKQEIIIMPVRRFFLFTLIVHIFFGCTRKEYVEVDVAPQLEITVTGASANPVPGATVTLFETQEDFYKNENPLETSVTDATGKVLFDELNEDIYYFYAEKGELNNFFEVVTFTIPLIKNEIRTITCILR